jgi:hypothetical protein
MDPAGPEEIWSLLFSFLTGDMLSSPCVKHH